MHATGQTDATVDKSDGIRLSWHGHCVCHMNAHLAKTCFTRACPSAVQSQPTVALSDNVGCAYWLSMYSQYVLASAEQF